MSAIDTHSTKKSGRKRAVLAAGALLGIGGLLTAAYFTDYGLLNLNGGTGGFGGGDNSYNLQFSAGQEENVASVATWLEANPDAEDVAPIPGAEALSPGGDAVYVNLPVLNQSATLDSTLSLTLENTTPVDADATQAAKNAAYAKLISISIAFVDDASTVPTTWAVENLAFDATGKTRPYSAANLAATEGKIAVVKIQLLDGATQAETNAANGGQVTIQARFDGHSL